MIGKEYPAEKKMTVDEKTGKAVWQLTAGESNNYHFYFTDNSFTMEKREIYFMSDRASRIPEIYNLYRMDLETGVICQLTDEKAGIMPGGHTKTPDSEFVIYVTGNKIKKLDTTTLKSTDIFEEETGIQLGHPFISPNKKVIGFARNEDPGLYRGGNYKGFKEQMYAVKRGWITLVDLDSTKATNIHEDTHWLGHFQFAPHDSSIAMFCHEGPWNLVHQRIWLLDIMNRTVIPCFRQAEDDCVGHEFWTNDGKIFFDNRRKGHDGTITSDKKQAIINYPEFGQIPYIGMADRNGEVIKNIPMPYYCNHYHATNDNMLLIGDQTDDLVLISLQDDKAQLKTLCTHHTSWYMQQSHCHPTFSWDNQQILFTSDRSGKCNLYMVEQENGKWL
jgi:oligogalacturonide lyase